MANGQMTLAQLILAAQQRADMVNSQFVSVPEWTSYINYSRYELYDLLVTSFGNDYYVAPPILITTDGTSQSYALPDGTLYNGAPCFYKLMGVDLSISGGLNSWVTLKTFKFNERNKYSVPNIQSRLGATNLLYRLSGDNLFFNIIPTANQYLRLWYVPRMTELVQLTDVADGVDGWLEYVIVLSAMKALQKEESDVSILMTELQGLATRIQNTAQNRDIGEAQTVSDTRQYDDDFGDGSDFGGY